MKRSVLLGLSLVGLIVSLLTLGAQLTILMQPSPGAPHVTAKAAGVASFCINSVPVLNIGCNTTMSQNSTYLCQVNATDSQNDTVTFSSNSTIFNITQSGMINFTPGNDHVGNHSVLITAVDSSGCAVNSTNGTFSFSVENINDPPYLIQDIPDTRFPANATIAAFFLNDYFADPDNDLLSFSSTIPTQFSLTILPSSEVRLTGSTCDASELVIFTAIDPYNATATSNTVAISITCAPEESGGGSDTGGGGGGGGGAARACSTKWECDEWYACLPTNVQWRRCYDMGGCEGEKYLKRSCEYPGPTPACQENWLCSEWGQCRVNGTQARTCRDLSTCGTNVTQPVTQQGCVYIATCNDNLQNGNETGVDCGGECASCALMERPGIIKGGIATWLLVIIVLSILLVSGVAHYYRAQIAQLIATIGFMLRHRAYKDILLDAATRKAYFERLLAFEQLLKTPAGKAMKPGAVYNALATMVRSYYVDALGVNSEALPEEVAARCEEMRLRKETTGMLTLFFGKLAIIEQEELEMDEYFVLATIEELRTIVCLTSEYEQEEINRAVEEIAVTEEMSFFDEIFVRSINAMRAVQFHQLDAARHEYMIILTRYDPMSEQEKEQIYPELEWLFGTMKFQSEITGAKVAKRQAA